MPFSSVTYDLQDGYIQHWLVVGPQSIPLPDVRVPLADEVKRQVAQRYATVESGVTRRPVEPGPLSEAEFSFEGYKGYWTHEVCDEDHFVDCTAFYPTPHYARAWAYTQLVAPQAGPLTLILTSYGPVDVWVNDVLWHQEIGFGFHHTPFTVDLREGSNALLIRFAQVGVQACPHAIALRVGATPAEIHGQIPTAIADLNCRRQHERAFAHAYLDRDVFVWDDFITLHWAPSPDNAEEVTVRLQTPAGRIYAESVRNATTEGKTTLVRAHQAPQGPLQLIVMPSIKLYYDENVRVRRKLCCWGLGWARYTEKPEGTYEQRRLAALQHAVRCEGALFGEVAKMALGMEQAIEPAVLLSYIERINRREVDSALYLLALLGMRYRWGTLPIFPAALHSPLEDCILHFAYEEPPETAEGEQILFRTCELMAGRLYPERQFAESGQTGQWHAEQGARRVLAWLRARAMEGFTAWDSGPVFEAELTALAHLVDLVEDENIWEMASVVLDKLLFTIALNSFQGVCGATQGYMAAPNVFGGWFSPLAGVTRLLWGMGILNPSLAAPVSLACMEDYELPPLMEEIATATPAEMWDCEQHLLPDGGSVNKVTYRTPDYLLGSAQDYRPGARGAYEHVWQATLGPGSVVFTNHPANYGTSEAHAPGFWRGNGVLPRVAQWRDALLAVYRLPDEDWLGYTHAYFPVYAFDEYCLRENPQGQQWAFARKGTGYLALTAARGLTFMTHGLGAYRELRSPGLHNIWVCQMGRAALDGEFAAFQERVLALPLTFADLTVNYTTLRHETLTFGWEGPFLRAGQEQPLAHFAHYANPYCNTALHATQMEIQSAQYLLRLQFAELS